MKLFRKLVIVLLMLTVMPCFALDLQKEPEITAYIQALVEKYNFDPEYLDHVFSKTQINQDVLKKMTQEAASPMPWSEYRKIFITPEKIAKGKAFWEKNRIALATAQSQYGVPAEVIAGIIGVETAYGDNKGKYPTIDALTTLGFKYPRRAAFFQSELTNFLLLCREQHWNPLDIKGSYAGAIGLPQFMPSSYRSYAVDYHRNGVKDLFFSSEDVIVSIGNYLQKKGWKVDQPVVAAAQKTNDKAIALVNKGDKLHYTIKQLAKNGIQPTSKTRGKPPVGVLFLVNGKDAGEYWITFTNFAVIKRYNSSNYYAMAVYELGNLVKPYPPKKV